MDLVLYSNEVLQNTSADPSKNGTVMEGHVFKKSHSREEYLNLIGKLFMHLRENFNRK